MTRGLAWREKSNFSANPRVDQCLGPCGEEGKEHVCGAGPRLTLVRPLAITCQQRLITDAGRINQSEGELIPAVPVSLRQLPSPTALR
jgi:hypothetical protein